MNFYNTKIENKPTKLIILLIQFFIVIIFYRREIHTRDAVSDGDGSGKGSKFES